VLPTVNVGALRGVPVAGGVVATAVNDAGDRFDAKIVIAIGEVAGQGRSGHVDVDAVVAIAAGQVANNHGAGGASVDQDPI
jgi:hypothetical protein